MKEEKPLVSVFVITYNHEKFIAQALDGILGQKTSFPFEIVIGEDCSTDNTRKIIEEYCKKFGNIRLLDSERNLGIVENAVRTLKECRGKYIAMCEGDDYWIDSSKLEFQVSFLEKNKGYTYCFHACYHLEQEEKIVPERLKRRWANDRDLELLDILNHRAGYTLSLVFNSEVLEYIDYTILSSFEVYDWILRFHCGMIGKGFFHSKYWGVYRKHSNNQSEKLMHWDSYYDIRTKILGNYLLDNNMKEEQKSLIRDFLCRLEFLMFKHCLKRKRILESGKHYISYIKSKSSIKTKNKIWDHNLQTKIL